MVFCIVSYIVLGFITGVITHTMREAYDLKIKYQYRWAVLWPATWVWAAGWVMYNSWRNCEW